MTPLRLPRDYHWLIPSPLMSLFTNNCITIPIANELRSEFLRQFLRSLHSLIPLTLILLGLPSAIMFIWYGVGPSSLWQFFQITALISLTFSMSYWINWIFHTGMLRLNPS